MAPQQSSETAASKDATPLRDLLAARLASAAPAQTAKTREDVARLYEAARGHKAQAASLQPAGSWRAAERPTAENAEDSVLENCQIALGQPCALLAVDEMVRPIPADGNWPKQDMPRARYSGTFDPAQIPGCPPALRERTDVVRYRSAAAPKAAAFTPVGGHVFTATGVATQREAEETALKACDGDPTRKAENGPCFLYAVGDQVVLPRRLREPLTPVAPSQPPLSK
jgi:hypothetical protein